MVVFCLCSLQWRKISSSCWKLWKTELWVKFAKRGFWNGQFKWTVYWKDLLQTCSLSRHWAFFFFSSPFSQIEMFHTRTTNSIFHLYLQNQYVFVLLNKARAAEKLTFHLNLPEIHRRSKTSLQNLFDPPWHFSPSIFLFCLYWFPFNWSRGWSVCAISHNREAVILELLN